MTTESRSIRWAHFAPLLAFGCFAALTATQFQRSFWLDETMTAWVIRADLSTSFFRIREFQGPGPLAFFLAWLWSKLFGVSEFALRSLSLGFALLAASLLKETLQERIRPSIALLASCSFLVLPEVWTAAESARGYSLALLYLIAALQPLFWKPLPPHSSTLYKSLALFCGAVYCQPLFALYLPLLFILAFPLSRWREQLKEYLFGGLLTAALLSPLAPQVAKILEKSPLMGFMWKQTPVELLGLFLPFPVLAVLIMTLLLLRGDRGKAARKERELSRVLIIYGFPVVSLLLLGMRFPILHPRYALPTHVGLIGILGVLWNHLPKQRSPLPATILISVLVPFHFFPQAPVEAWREGVQLLSKNNECTFLASGHAESRSVSYLLDHQNWEYLSSPLRVYNSTIPAIPLPLTPLTKDFERYSESVLKPQLLHCPRPILIGRQLFVRGINSNEQSIELWESWFRSQGYRTESSSRFGTVLLLQFAKD